MKRLLLMLGLLLAPAIAAAQEPGIVPFEVAVAGLAAEDATTRSAAARELAFQGRPEAAAAILAALAKPETDPWVRKDFYAALGQLGGEGVLAALLGCLESESRAELVGECAAALGNLADPAAIPALLRLVEAVTPAGLVRLRAVDALGFFADPAAGEALIALLEDPSAEVRRHAIAALALNGGEAAAAALLRRLRAPLGDEEAALSVQSLGWLAQRIDLSFAVPQLAPLLGPRSAPQVFAKTAHTLGSIGGEAAVAVLSGVLHGLPLQRQWEVVRALGRTKSALAVPALLAELSLARDDYLASGVATAPGTAWVERLAVMRALCQALLASGPLGTAGVVAPLAAGPPRPEGAVLAGPQWSAAIDLRLAAIDLLGADRGSPIALDTLLAVAADDLQRVRPAAVLALGRLGRVEAGPALGALLGSAPDRTLRWAAALALGQLGDAASLPVLEKAAAEDPDALVRRAAAEAAARIDQQD
jgi:HEAT repeat protein